MRTKPGMSYADNEPRYRQLIERFARQEIGPTEFCAAFMQQWKLDRDAQWALIDAGQADVGDRELCEVLNQVFTACDVFDPVPTEEWEIDAEAFLREVRGLFEQRWGSGGGA